MSQITTAHAITVHVNADTTFSGSFSSPLVGANVPMQGRELDGFWYMYAGEEDQYSADGDTLADVLRSMSYRMRITGTAEVNGYVIELPYKSATREIPQDYITKVIDTARAHHAIELLPLACKRTETDLRWNAEPWVRDDKYDAITDMSPRVVEVKAGSEVDEFGALWTVEVQYSRKGWRAIYGVSPDGRVELYAN